MKATDSFAGHTLLTVTLPAANLGLEAVALETDAPFFIRRVDATLHTVTPAQGLPMRFLEAL